MELQALLRLSHMGKIKALVEMIHHVTVAATMTSTASVRLRGAIEIVRALVHRAMDSVAIIALRIDVTLPLMVRTVVTGVAVAEEEDETIVNEAQIDHVGVLVHLVGIRPCHRQVQGILSTIVHFHQII